MIERSQIFINGKWADSSGDGVISVINPATEEAIATVPAGSSEDAGRAVEAAAIALEGWSGTSLDERLELITALADALTARSEEITDTIVREVGMPKKIAVAGQTGGAIEDLRVIAQVAREIVWDEQVGNATVSRVPAGVVGAITPWNVPLKMICLKAGAAMAAGCTVVLKGSEVAPLSSFIFAEAAAEAGVPDGVFNLVSGPGPVVGEAIAGHPLVDVVSLTGSVRAGQRIVELSAATIKKLALELGGKSAGVVFEDADFERAIPEAIEDAFRNSGQVCGGVTRVLVPRARLAEAENLAAQKAGSYVLGDPFDPATTLGPVVSATQRDRIRGYIRLGPQEGARLLTGGPDAPEGLDRGYYVRPTVFTGNNTMRVAREEIFGPVVVLIPYEDENDAIAIANDSEFGLAGAVWAGDAERARALARRIRTGRVRVNGAPLNRLAPHGGVKMSGLGREWGRFGMEEFLEYQSIIG